MTATRWPVKSTPSCGHRPVWYESPANVSAPGNCGALDADSAPTAVMTNCAVTERPVSVVTVHRLVASSNVAAVTRVLNSMSRFRSYRSATCSR